MRYTAYDILDDSSGELGVYGGDRGGERVIVFNTNPIGTKPVMIVVDYLPSSDGGPAEPIQTVSVAPGQGVDLMFLGLLTHEEQLLRKKIDEHNS